MSKRMIISVMATVMAAMVSSVASAGSARVDARAGGQNGVLSVSDIALSLLSYGLAPKSDAVLRGPYYVLHATNPWGREVRVVADAYFGDILSVVPVYSWRTNPYLHHGTIARIIHVPQGIYGDTDAEPQSRQRSGRAAAPRRTVSSAPPPQRADADKALTPIHPTPDFGPKAGDSAPFDRPPPPSSHPVE